MRNLMRSTGIIIAFIAVSSVFSAQAKENVLQKIGPEFEKEFSEQVRQLILAYPDLEGSLKLAITIDKSGWVVIAEAKEVRVDDSEPLTAILERVHKWKFSPLDIKEKNITLAYDIIFSDDIDQTRVFFIVMGVIIATIAALIVLVRVG